MYLLLVIRHLMRKLEGCVARVDEVKKSADILDEPVRRRCDEVAYVDRLFVSFIHDCDFLGCWRYKKALVTGRQRRRTLAGNTRLALYTLLNLRQSAALAAFDTVLAVELRARLHNDG